MPRPSESCLTPASYTTRLNHFYARDENRRTIANAAGEIDKFIFAPYNLIATAIESGVVVRDAYLKEAEKLTRQYAGSSPARLAFDDPVYWDPIDAAVNGISTMDGAEYALHLDPSQSEVALRFPSESFIYRFVQRWRKGYYPQLLTETS